MEIPQTTEERSLKPERSPERSLITVLTTFNADKVLNKNLHIGMFDLRHQMNKKNKKEYSNKNRQLVAAPVSPQDIYFIHKQQ